ncbi:MAG: ATP-binding protein [Roseiflexaceae bacterium]|nr:ATP-binding protein [Roseiflexaceae bacterium]
MNTPIPFSALMALATTDLVNFRSSRYLGDNISVPIASFADEDQGRIRSLYGTLQALLELVRTHLDAPANGLPALRSFGARVGWSDLVRQMQQIGEPGRYQGDETLQRVIHDIRGGGFQALSIQLQFINFGISQADDLHRLFFLTRDHLKIMRNAVLNLDPAGYERDRGEQLHSVDLLTEKWQHAIHNMRGRSATVHVACAFDGNVSERCLEFAALDRVLYNLMNNAVRNTGDDAVFLAILPLPSAEPENLRFVIYNRIDADQRALLRERYADDLGALFHGGFTTGGTGLGMRICADFVINAFGIRTVSEGLRGGYFGAGYQGDYFVNWFHWPIAAD